MKDDELNKIIWGELSKNASCDLTEEENSFVMDTMPFHIRFEQKDNPRFIYEQNGKSIILTPVGYKWDNYQEIIKSKKIKGKRREGNSQVIDYKDIFDKGISIENEVSKNGWKKIIKIEDKESLGQIPTEAKYLEFIFEIETDFDIKNSNGIPWDKTNESFFVDDLILGENIKIEKVKAWYFDEKNDQETAICNGVLFEHEGKTYLKKQIPIDFIMNSSGSIFTDIVISYGSEYQPTTAVFGAITVCALTPLKFIAVWYGYAVVGTISGTVISYGTVKSFSPTAYPSYISSCKVTDTRILVAYEGSAIYLFTIDESNGILTVNTAMTWLDNSSRYDKGSTTLHLKSIDSGSAFLGTSIYYSDDGSSYYYDNYCSVVTIYTNGTVTISQGFTLSGQGWGGVSLNYVEVISLSSTSYIVAESASGYTTACRVLTYSGTWSMGARNVVGTGVQGFTMTPLSSTTFLIYEQGSNNFYIGTVSGTSISFGSGTTAGSDTKIFTRSAKLSDGTIVVVYRNGTDNYGKMFTVNVSGTTITVGASQVFKSTITYWPVIIAMASNSFVLGYGGYVTPNNYLYSLAGSIPIIGKKINGAVNSKWNGVSIMKWNGI